MNYEKNEIIDQIIFKLISLIDYNNTFFQQINIIDINYNEENEVLRDYREDGVGFYWVNLETNNSPEECERMGHCGRTNSNNTIYSLRETKRLNPKYTLNKSHLTAAVGNDNVLYQMKGPKNSKPQEKFYPYIIDLLLNDDSIQSFGSEYDSASDFNLVDLSEEQIKKIYEPNGFLSLIYKWIGNTLKVKKYKMSHKYE